MSTLSPPVGIFLSTTSKFSIACYRHCTRIAAGVKQGEQVQASSGLVRHEQILGSVKQMVLP